MNEATFRKFGTCLDELESVLSDTTDVIQKAYLKSCINQLDRIYNEIKEACGYKDNSDNN